MWRPLNLSKCETYAFDKLRRLYGLMLSAHYKKYLR